MFEKTKSVDAGNGPMTLPASHLRESVGKQTRAENEMGRPDGSTASTRTWTGSTLDASNCASGGSVWMASTRRSAMRETLWKSGVQAAAARQARLANAS